MKVTPKTTPCREASVAYLIVYGPMLASLIQKCFPSYDRKYALIDAYKFILYCKDAPDVYLDGSRLRFMDEFNHIRWRIRDDFLDKVVAE
jgi:hypothetical protein